MGEETAQRLTEAEADMEARRVEVDARVRECLEIVARGIPARVDEIAKKAAHSQPAVAKQLGVEGIKELRRELADAAAALASEVEAAVEQVEWPRARSIYAKVLPRDIHSALFTFLYGKRVDGLAAVVKRHGFSIRDDNAQHSQHLILPQSLYSEDDFVSLAEALTSLSAAELAVTEAKVADDRAVVDSLWTEE